MKKIYVILILLWFGITFSFSSDQKVETREKSDFFVRKVSPLLKDFYEKIEKPIPNREKIGKVIRKTAHFLNYSILGIIVILSFGKKMRKNEILIAIILGFILASIDEIHQRFVPGRDGNITDVIIDVSGVIFGIIVVNILKYKKRPNF